MTTENIPDPDDPRPTQQKVARVYLSQYLTGPELANTKDAAELIVDVGMYISSVEGAAAEAIKSLTGNCHNDSEVMNDLSELIERLTAFW